VVSEQNGTVTHWHRQIALDGHVSGQWRRQSPYALKDVTGQVHRIKVSHSAPRKQMNYNTDYI
jgi:hypothetical protein